MMKFVVLCMVIYTVNAGVIGTGIGLGGLGLGHGLGVGHGIGIGHVAVAPVAHSYQAISRVDHAPVAVVAKVATPVIAAPVAVGIGHGGWGHGGLGLGGLGGLGGLHGGIGLGGKW